jgi:hypothetical protein
MHLEGSQGPRANPKNPRLRPLRRCATEHLGACCGVPIHCPLALVSFLYIGLGVEVSLGQHSFRCHCSCHTEARLKHHLHHPIRCMGVAETCVSRRRVDCFFWRAGASLACQLMVRRRHSPTPQGSGLEGFVFPQQQQRT